MTASHLNKRAVRALVSLALAMLLVAGTSSAQAAAPQKLVPTNHIGWEVDGTTKASICTVESTDICQPGKRSTEPGGFREPESVAVAPDGDIYVADDVNERVQELTANGEFVLMFGKEVNETNDSKPGAGETEKDVCAETEIKTHGVKCKQGVPGTTAGALDEPQGVAVDPVTGNVYVQNKDDIDEYTPSGQFILRIGKEVNETEDDTSGASEAQKNLCTAESTDVCKAGAPSEPESAERGAFDYPAYDEGNLLTVGSELEHLLYVGDKHRVQEFNAGGEWKGEIKLPDATFPVGEVLSVESIAVDSKTERLYLDYASEPVVHEFDTATGIETSSFEVASRSGRKVVVDALAVDAAGNLAVVASESVSQGEPSIRFGSFYEASDGRLTSEFREPLTEGADIFGIGFNDKNELYAAINVGPREVERYAEKPIAELLPGALSCVPGAESETDATLLCSLNGQVDPWGVPGTEVWFQWGRTSALGSETPKVSVATGEALVPVSSAAAVVRPGEAAFYYRLAAVDQNSPSPETFTSEKVSFATPIVAPRIVGAPGTSFLTASSAVLEGELNPENANTRYEFQYAPMAACENLEVCPGESSTPTLESAVYAKTGAAQEISGLQPDTTYRVRLFAESENDKKTEQLSSVGQEATFTTAVAPALGAQTGQASGVSATGATISGSVNPDGVPATYAFELGVYAGTLTQYGIVLSGPAGAGTTPVEEALGLSGLQPGTTYAFRITVSSGYVKNATHTLYGSPATFTTAGIPAVLVSPASLALLATPATAFPKPPAAAQVKATKGKSKKSKGKKSKARKAKKSSAHKHKRKPVKGGK